MTTIDPEAFIQRCRRAQRRGALAIICDSSVDDAPAGARLAVHPGGYLESEIDDDTVRARIAADARTAIATGRSASRRYGVLGGAVDVEIAVVVPAPRLFVFGGGDLAALIGEAAHMAGMDPILCGTGAISGETAAAIDISDRAAAIVLAAGDAHDRRLIESLLVTAVRYVGVAGPPARIEPMIEHVLAAGPDARLHAAIEVDLAVETGRGIACALVAEARAVVSGNVAIRPSLRRMAMVASAAIA